MIQLGIDTRYALKMGISLLSDTASVGKRPRTYFEIFIQGTNICYLQILYLLAKP